jgi:hypothetical protein
MIAFTEELTLDQKRELLIKFLSELHCEVTFTKVNGERRIMPCTLNPSLIPEQPFKETTKTKKSNPETMSVWCTDKQSWRSFRVNSVENLKILV